MKHAAGRRKTKRTKAKTSLPVQERKNGSDQNNQKEIEGKRKWPIHHVE